MLKKFRNIFGKDVVINTSTVVSAEECFPDDEFDDNDEIFLKIKLITGDVVEVVGTLDDLIS